MVCLADCVGVVEDELVQHLLRVFRAVQERVDVGPDELADASKDRRLGHFVSPPFKLTPTVGVLPDRSNRS